MLLIDEMYVREDLVFDRYTGKIIGFANMGDINNHLAKLEASLVSGDTSPPLAKTMVVIMIRGIFSKLQYPYAHSHVVHSLVTNSMIHFGKLLDVWRIVV